MNRNDIDLLAALSWFLNARITTAKQVEGRFGPPVRKQNAAMIPLRPLTKPSWESQAADAEAADAEARPMTDAEALDSYRKQQITARELVPIVLAYDKKPSGEREHILALVANALGNTVKAALGIGFTARKGLILDVRVMLPTVEAAITYGFALVLGDKTLRRRLGMCAHEGCSLYFFDTRQHGGGQQRYCSQAHSDLDRVARWRLKKSLERKPK